MHVPHLGRRSDGLHKLLLQRAHHQKLGEDQELTHHVDAHAVPGAQLGRQLVQALRCVVPERSTQ